MTARLLDRHPALAAALAALFTVTIGVAALVLVALLAPLLARCPWERGRRFVQPGAHRSRVETWSMRADVRTQPFGAVTG